MTCAEFTPLMTQINVFFCEGFKVGFMSTSVVLKSTFKSNITIQIHLANDFSDSSSVTPPLKKDSFTVII